MHSFPIINTPHHHGISVITDVPTVIYHNYLKFPSSRLKTHLPMQETRDEGLIPGSGRSPGGGHGNSLQYSCLENPMDREAWWATVNRVPKSWTWLKWQHACMYLKFKAYIKIHSWCCVFYEFWQMYLYNEIYTSLQYHIGHLHCPKALLYLFTYPFPLSPGNHWKYL